MGAMALVIIISTIIFISITVALARSRRVLRADLECLKAKTIEQPAIYEELDYMHMAPKPASSPTPLTQDRTQLTCHFQDSSANKCNFKLKFLLSNQHSEHAVNSL